MVFQLLSQESQIFLYIVKLIKNSKDGVLNDFYSIIKIERYYWWAYFTKRTFQKLVIRSISKLSSKQNQNNIKRGWNIEQNSFNIFIQGTHWEHEKLYINREKLFSASKKILRNRGKKQSSKRRRNPHRGQQEIKRNWAMEVFKVKH